IPNQERDFDETWYKDNIQAGLRDLIIRTPIVETEKGLQSIKTESGEVNIIFPKADSNKARKKIYEFTQNIHPEKLPKSDLIDEWADLIWKEDCSFQTVEELIEQVAAFKNLDKIQ